VELINFISTVLYGPSVTFNNKMIYFREEWFRKGVKLGL
jgi:hypothetical protein